MGQATAHTLEMIEHGVSVGKHRSDCFAEIDDAAATDADHGINALSKPLLGGAIHQLRAGFTLTNHMVMTGSSIVDQALHNAQLPHRLQRRPSCDQQDGLSVT